MTASLIDITRTNKTLKSESAIHNDLSEKYHYINKNGVATCERHSSNKLKKELFINPNKFFYAKNGESWEVVPSDSISCSICS